MDHIKVFQSAYWQLNSIVCNYLGTTIVWDPAYTDREINDIYLEARKTFSDEKYLIYTHGDFDHILGDAHFEGFQKLGSMNMAQKTNKAKVIEQINTTDDEYYLDRLHSIQFPILDQVIEENISLMLGSVETYFYKAGGHTSDGMFTIIPSIGLWVAGDYLSDIEFPFIEDNIDEYYKTLDTADRILNSFDIKFMVPGHGNPTNSTSQIKSRIDQSLRYLDSFTKPNIDDWRKSWGYSPFEKSLDKMHLKNIKHVRSQSI